MDTQKDAAADLLVAVTRLMARSGASSTTLRFCDQDEPPVWVASTTWERFGGAHRHGAGDTAAEALQVMVEKALDGGQCVKCKRPVVTQFEASDAEILALVSCHYVYEQAEQAFRRTCDGELIGLDVEAEVS